MASEDDLTRGRTSVPDAPPQTDIVWVAVPFSNREYEKLRSEAIFLASGTAWEAVRARMLKGGYKVLSEMRARRALVAEKPLRVLRPDTTHRLVIPKAVVAEGEADGTHLLGRGR